MQDIPSKLEHSNRFQFLQVTPSTHPVQYVSMQNYNEPRQISRERDSNQIPYQQVCPKGFQSLRIMSQPDGNQSKSPVVTAMQPQPNTRPNQNSNSLQMYIDNALKNQREEMLKLLEQQNKQIDYMHQQQQLIIQQQQQQQEKKKEPVNIESQLNQVKEQLQIQITQGCREMIHKLQKQEQTDFKALQVQIEKLKSQLYQINLSTSKQSEKLQQSYKGKENEPEEYQYKKHIPQRNSVDNYDQYIKKYEQFNKQVNDYLINRKIPDHLSSILNSSKDSNSEIHDIEYIQSDHPLTDITNIQNIKQNKSSQPLQQIAQPSIPQQFVSQKTTIQPSNQSNEDSPIKALNEQMMIDSLDNINVHDPNSLQITKEEFDQLKSQRMSTIHENEDEDEELMYQVDENGFVLSQDGHPLIDETGKRIQLTKQELQFYKSKLHS
ncbi:unnamed protein product (macronuclear) [Paramecium tetraurelia]|uniref:Uncharacterized protein n=1 Tax=Paramecium tetraurelia TaxID=5888 RepID=A0CXC2_PARTE|nr:uncharacterized protein GSPATT00011071001 [Paramecium tetraurelia]CAK75439.1 unnamed protein product [Paramecium tetraurelia]|eukprot:XP_001442836.1 hypothetical protein (macronuclear) [Paramecium tetraurelia strain d4-2]